MFTEREIAIMHTAIIAASPISKEASEDEIMAINQFIKDQFFPNITYDEYYQLGLDFNSYKDQIIKTMMAGFNTAIGKDDFDFSRLLGNKLMPLRQVEMLQSFQKQVKQGKVKFEPSYMRELEEKIRSKVGAKPSETVEDLITRLKKGIK